MDRLDTLLQGYPLIQAPQDYAVLSQGQECENCLVVSEGVVKVFGRSEDGRELVLYRIRPGEMCVLTTSCLLGGGRFPAEAVTESAVSARVIPLADFQKLLASSDMFRQFVFTGFSQRLSELMLQLELVTLARVDQRLLKFLLSHRQSLIQLTHQDIAAEIGSAREVVSRHLKGLEKQGLLALQRGCVQLIDREALQGLLKAD